MEIRAINNGYYSVKCAGQSFKSRIAESVINKTGSGIDLLEYGKYSYLIGTGSANLEYDKTESIHTKLLILNMLARFTAPGTQQTFKIGITTPANQYFSQSKTLPEYLIGRYDVTHNHTPKIIEIIDVEVFPEGICAIAANAEKLQLSDKRVICIDIGGLTTNVCYVENSDFIAENLLTINRGMYNIDLEISQQLSSLYKMPITAEDVDYGRQHNNMLNKKKQINMLDANKDIFKAVYNSHIADIKQLCRQKGYNTDMCDILLTGGGCIAMKEYLTAEDVFPQAVMSDNPIFDNYNGLEIYTKWVFNK